MRHIRQAVAKRVAACLILAVGMTATGCVTTLQKGRELEYRIDILEVRLQEESEAREAALEEEIARLDERLEEMSSVLESLGVATRRTSADVGVTLESLNEEMRGVQGRIDELRHYLERTREENERLRDTLDRRFAGLEGETAVAEVEARQAARKAERPDEPGAFLAMARSRLEDGEHAVARNLLLEFQRRWQDVEQADEAQLLIAESYFLQGDHRSAILEFNKVREKYPDSRLMPQALLRLGESFAALELKREARDFFDAVIRAYPDDPAAAEAKDRKRSL